MLVAYNLVGKGFHSAQCSESIHITLGEHKRVIESREIKEEFLETMSLEEGGEVSQAMRRLA